MRRIRSDTETADGEFATLVKLTYTDHGIEKHFDGIGNGPIDAVQRGLEEALGIQIKVLDYTEHALASGSGAQAASYIHLVDQTTGKATYGVGISSNITRASIRGMFQDIYMSFRSLSCICLCGRFSASRTGISSPYAPRTLQKFGHN